MRDYAEPVIGKPPVEHIPSGHIAKILATIWKVKPETAARIRGRIEMLLDYAHDRRGHVDSDRRWNGNNMDRYADDLADLMKNLNLNNRGLVGHSTGGREVAHCNGRLGSKRVAKVVLVGAVPP